MRSRRGRLVVLGIAARTPVAGVAWQVLHYLEGFRRLGFDVYYVEDTGDWPYDPERNTIGEDSRYPVSYLARLMAWAGFGDRWAYRSGPEGGRLHGLPERTLAEVLGTADAVVNVTGATVLRDEHRRVPVRIFLETDPFVPQVEVARGERFTIDLLSAHTHHFTFGENLGAADCPVPLGPFAYRPTRQPIVLDWWAAEAPPDPGAPFTTVASWRQSGKDIEWQGSLYRWSKHLEFLKFADLPRHTGEPLELALTLVDDEAKRLLTDHGWRLRDGLALSLDIRPYREYLQGSRGEVTVAKDQYVRSWSGWFSDRSACYLAAGRPVVTQETGFSKLLPTGKGLFAFRDLGDIVTALDEIAGDYGGHCRSAREIAAEHFGAEPVLSRLCDEAGL
jgi:hypothetical protein